MTGVILGVLGVGIILLIDEAFWRLHILRGELARKLVHVLVGTYIAFWPFMMSFEAIRWLAGAMLVVVALSRRFGLFKSIHEVKRRTYGELFFPISVGVCAALTGIPWVYTAAILHLSLADGLAALLGIAFGDMTTYRVFGQAKSWFGTAVFYLCSLFIVSYVLLTHIEGYGNLTLLVAALLPLLATLGESVSVYGTDDLVVPIGVCLALAAVAA